MSGELKHSKGLRFFRGWIILGLIFGQLFSGAGFGFAAPGQASGAVYYVNPAANTDMVLYWPMDLNSSLPEPDISGFGNNGTMTWGIVPRLGGAPTLYPNPMARTSGGTSVTNISAPDAASLDLAEAFSISMWINLYDADKVSYLVSKMTAERNSAFSFGVSASGVWGSVADSSGTLRETWGGGGKLTKYVWSHVAMTFQRSGQLKLYINGLEVAGLPVGDLPAGVNDSSLVVGNTPWSPAVNGADGSMDDLRIYNRALSPAEIGQLSAGKCVESGTSWARAFYSLQCALVGASAVSEIWVVQGVHRTSPMGGRSPSFNLKDGVSLYGGFTGNETLRHQRSSDASLTVLSGDLLGDDEPGFTNRSDNAYHVVVGNNLSNATVVDGFTIQGGYADYVLPLIDYGGGIFLEGSSPMLSNLVITDNYARRGGGLEQIASYYGTPAVFENLRFIGNKAVEGGGMASENNNKLRFNASLFQENQADNGGGLWVLSLSLNYVPPAIDRLRFYGNTASQKGGAVYLKGSYVTVTSSLFVANRAALGGAVYAEDSDYWAFNDTLVANQASVNGSVFYNAVISSFQALPKVVNAILWANTGPSQIYNLENRAQQFIYQSLIQGGCPSACSGTIFNLDPLFTRAPSDGGDGWGVGGNDDYGDLSLQPGSPAVDVGDKALDIDRYTPGIQPLPVLDMAGMIRVDDYPPPGGTGVGLAPFIDLGAYESHIVSLHYLPLMLRH